MNKGESRTIIKASPKLCCCVVTDGGPGRRNLNGPVQKLQHRDQRPRDQAQGHQEGCTQDQQSQVHKYD
jgi:hypothetical protein